MMRPRSLTALAVATGLLLSACSSGDGDGESPETTPGTTDDASTATGGESAEEPTEAASYVTGGEVRIALSGDPGSLDPHLAVSGSQLELALFAYDTIISLSPDGEYLPALAESWTEEGGTYVFEIREDVTCADGSDLTAEVIAANVNYVTDPENASPMNGLYVAAGTTAEASGSTLTLTPGGPAPFLFQGLATFPIVCQAGLDDRESLAGATHGSGPYVLENVVPGDEYVYTVREDYAWGPDGNTTAEEGQPGTVTYKLVSDQTTLANLLLAGDINIGAVGGADIERLSSAGLESQQLVSPAGEFFFNQRDGAAVADLAVRQAIIQAVDLSGLREVFGGGLAIEPTQLMTLEPIICPTESVAANVPQHDPAGAAALLEDAGWVAGSDGVREKDGTRLELTLTYASGPETDAAAELAVAMWQEAGIAVTTAGATDADVINTMFGGGTWDIAWQGIGVLNPAQLVPFFTGEAPPDGSNFNQSNNQAYADLTSEAMELPGQEGCSLWVEAEVELLKNLDIVPFAFGTQHTWGTGVEFEMIPAQVRPTTLRQVEG